MRHKISILYNPRRLELTVNSTTPTCSRKSVALYVTSMSSDSCSVTYLPVAVFIYTVLQLFLFPPLCGARGSAAYGRRSHLWPALAAARRAAQQHPFTVASAGVAGVPQSDLQSDRRLHKGIDRSAVTISGTTKARRSLTTCIIRWKECDSHISPYICSEDMIYRELEIYFRVIWTNTWTETNQFCNAISGTRTRCLQ